MKKVCEEYDICRKYKRNPSRPVVGLPLAENFNGVLTVDLGGAYEDRFLVIVDWATLSSHLRRSWNV